MSRQQAVIDVGTPGMSFVRASGVEVTYAAAISSCEKSRQWEMALKLFSEISARAASNVVPNYPHGRFQHEDPQCAPHDVIPKPDLL